MLRRGHFKLMREGRDQHRAASVEEPIDDRLGSLLKTPEGTHRHVDADGPPSHAKGIDSRRDVRSYDLRHQSSRESPTFYLVTGPDTSRLCRPGIAHRRVANAADVR
jgi:hypothetical protein